jgi:hypothetical protein
MHNETQDHCLKYDEEFMISILKKLRDSIFDEDGERLLELELLFTKKFKKIFNLTKDNLSIAVPEITQYHLNEGIEEGYIKKMQRAINVRKTSQTSQVKNLKLTMHVEEHISSYALTLKGREFLKESTGWGKFCSTVRPYWAYFLGIITTFFVQYITHKMGWLS